CACGAVWRGATSLAETECAVAPVDTRRRGHPWAGLPLLGDSAVMLARLVGDGMAMALLSAEWCGPLVDGYLRALFSWQELGRRYQRRWHGEVDRRRRRRRLVEGGVVSP